MLEMFEKAGLRIIQYWKDPQSEYRLWLLEKPAFYFPLLPDVAKRMGSPSSNEEQPKTSTAVNADSWSSIPSRQEWDTLWKYWDLVTLDMIPENMLHQKPIDLRHKCLFYLGHIPTFLDIHLTRMTDGKHTEPERFKDIFERGIDPHVDDPSKIHDHSAVPEKDEEWPVLREILDFRDRVRARLLALYDDIDTGKRILSRRVGRILWMTFEHEAFHVEVSDLEALRSRFSDPLPQTLLYMLLQSPATLPPPGFAHPNWSDLARQWDESANLNRLLAFSASTVTLGHNDRESEDRLFAKDDSWLGHEFGWDNENPASTVSVRPFRVQSLPITNGDYHEFWKANGIERIPGSWNVDRETSEVTVKSLYGAVPLEVAQYWPLMASYEEIDAFAKWKGGRLPTEAEMRVLWNSPMGPRPASLSANVGLRNWHPIP
jgi:formylglycine-generating enzyme required for sulfatase activity